MSNRVDITIGGKTDPSLASAFAGVSGLLGGLIQKARLLPVVAAAGASALAKVGVGFNAQIESASISFGALLRQMAPAQFGTMTSALQGAATLVRELRVEALLTTATFRDLVAGTQSLMAAALAAGIPLDRIPSVVATISRAMSVVLPDAQGYQLGQEGRALLTGEIGPDAQLARTLGIRRDDVLGAIQANRLVDFLTERLGAFNAAAELTSQTLGGLWSNLQDVLDSVTGGAMEGTLAALKDLVRETKSLVGSASFGAFLGQLGNLTESVVRLGAVSMPAIDRVLGWVVGFFDWLQEISLQLDVVRQSIFRTSDPSVATAEAYAAWLRARSGQLSEEDAATTSTALSSGIAEVIRSGGVRSGQWSAKLPWDTTAGGADGGLSVRGWLTRGSMQLWTQQINYARSMAKDLGIIAQVVQRYLPKLQEQI